MKTESRPLLRDPRLKETHMSNIQDGKDVVTQALSHTTSGNTTWGKTFEKGMSVKKLKLELPYDPEIPLLAMCQR